MSDRPKAEATECARQPQQMPKVVSRAALRPRERVLRTTRAVSARGVIVRQAARVRNTQNLESIPGDISTWDAKGSRSADPACWEDKCPLSGKCVQWRALSLAAVNLAVAPRQGRFELRAGQATSRPKPQLPEGWPAP